MVRERLLTERLKRKLTQKQVAEKLHISEVYVRKLEKGDANPGRELMLKFENFYDVPARELFPDLFQQNNDTKCINKLA